MTPPAGRVLSAEEIETARAAGFLPVIGPLLWKLEGRPAVHAGDLLRTLEVRVSPIAEVHEKYKHLDALFSDRRMLPDTEAWHALGDLWAAVKRAMMPDTPTAPSPAPLPAPRLDCNRHTNCAEADAKWKAAHPHARHIPLSFHCHDECCEDCFGA